jgi:hypothetical protein
VIPLMPHKGVKCANPNRAACLLIFTSVVRHRRLAGRRDILIAVGGI